MGWCHILFIIATLGSILDSQLSWESGKFQLARWSHEVVIFSERTYMWLQLQYMWLQLQHICGCSSNICGCSSSRPPDHIDFFTPLWGLGALGMYGGCLKVDWGLSGKCKEGVWTLSGRCLKVSGRRLEGVWKMSVMYWEGRKLALRLNSQNQNQMTTSMDGHLPSLG